MISLSPPVPAERRVSPLRAAVCLFLVATTAAGAVSPLTLLHEFSGHTHGWNPSGPLLASPDGRLYGLAEFGGRYSDSGAGGGTVYAVQPNGSKRVTLFHFDAWETGDRPIGRLLQGAEGRLYGVTSSGGSAPHAPGEAADGTVFSLRRDGGDFRVLHRFYRPTTGGTPTAGLTAGADGRLYGITRTGGRLPDGSYGDGTLYSIDTDGRDFRVLHVFDTRRGESADSATLMLGADGRLYGTTNGPDGATLFTLGATQADFGVIHRFDAALGAPVRGLVLGADGALYGALIDSFGQQPAHVFRFDPVSLDFKVILTLSSAEYPIISELLSGADGRLYGILHGYTATSDAVFAVQINGHGFDVLEEIPADTAEIQVPEPLTQDKRGRLFGVSQRSPFGHLFAVNPSGDGFRMIHTFAPEAPGGYLPQTLVPGIDGRLYGSTLQGGAHLGGTLFSIKTNGTGFKTIYSFNPHTEADEVYRTLTRGWAGRWFGGSHLGGADEGGVVYTFHAPTRRLRVLHAFDANRYWQEDMPLVFSRDRNLYGYLNWYDQVFSVHSQTGAYTLIHQAEESTGIDPYGLVEAAPGHLVGVMRVGGDHGGGTLYAFASGGRNFRVEEHLGGSGDSPAGPTSLLRASTGRLYGTSSQGLFLIDPPYTHARLLPPRFDEGATLHPLLEASDGRLYGTTSHGGTNAGAILYSVDGDGMTFTVHHHYPPGADQPAPPAGALAEGRDGRLYAASWGGRYRLGLLYAFERPLRIISEPADVTLAEGEPATLRVGAMGHGPLRFQWYRNGWRLPAADSAVLHVTEPGRYHVRVSARGKSIWSATATVTPPSPSGGP